MLLLTRRIGQTIYIGDDIRVTVHDRLRYHVTLGVVAPTELALHYSGAQLAPAVLPGGEHLYFITLLAYEGLFIVIYPDETWYTYLDKDDIDEIIDEHLIKGNIVERLRI